MKINEDKTKLLCMNVSQHSNINTYINVSGGTVVGTDEIMMLGFKFGRRPNADAHLKYMKRRFYSKIWILRHFKRAGTSAEEILKVYTSYVRPTIEYASCVYGPLLTLTQSEEVEKMQERAIKICYGFGQKYENILQKTGLEKLSERRHQALRKLAEKTSQNTRYIDRWYTENNNEKNLRRTERIHIPFARSERYKNGQLNVMRRILNTVD